MATLLKYVPAVVPQTEALLYVGGLSTTSKMPCPSYSIPTYACKTGGILQEVEGSVCYRCYASKGNYRWPAVVNAMERRLASLSDLPRWIDCMHSVLMNLCISHFRWHDSGDVQSYDHLVAIVRLAQLLPSVKFWLPTKEYKLVERFTSAHETPDNLCIRVSAPMVGLGYLASRKYRNISVVDTLDSVTVQATAQNHGVWLCPARNQDHKCGTCRACWDKGVHTVAYQKI